LFSLLHWRLQSFRRLHLPHSFPQAIEASKPAEKKILILAFCFEAAFFSGLLSLPLKGSATSKRFPFSDAL